MPADDEKDVPSVGEQPTKQEPGQDPDDAPSAQPKGRERKPTVGVQPMDPDDIPEAGR